MGRGSSRPRRRRWRRRRRGDADRSLRTPPRARTRRRARGGRACSRSDPLARATTTTTSRSSRASTRARRATARPRRSPRTRTPTRPSCLVLKPNPRPLSRGGDAAVSAIAGRGIAQPYLDTRMDLRIPRLRFGPTPRFHWLANNRAGPPRKKSKPERAKRQRELHRWAKEENHFHRACPLARASSRDGWFFLPSRTRPSASARARPGHSASRARVRTRLERRSRASRARTRVSPSSWYAARARPPSVTSASRAHFSLGIADVALPTAPPPRRRRPGAALAPARTRQPPPTPTGGTTAPRRR